MTIYGAKEIKTDLSKFLHERSEFTEFGRLVIENSKPYFKSFIIVPEGFVYENQSFSEGFHSHTQAQNELNKFINRNPDITMLISDDFNA